MNVWAGKPVVSFSEHVFAGNDYVNFLECLVESVDTRWRGVKGQAPRVVGQSRCEGSGKVRREVALGQVPMEVSQVPRVVERWRKASQARRVAAKARKEQCAGRASCWEQGVPGDFVEKMMKGEFATGPELSAEPAAPGLGVERSLCRVENVVARAAK